LKKISLTTKNVLRSYIFLVFVFLVFFATRLYKIGSIPSSVYWDEASIGYNAYSVLTTGRDEWGSFLPVHFRAFGEFKLPVYVYSVVPFVKLFGLSAVSIRLPSVIYSCGIVLLCYLLTMEITKNRAASLFSAFYIVVTPWLFIFSRAGYEVTAGLFFYLLGMCLLFTYKKKYNFVLLLVSFAVFILSVYSYNSFRLLTPITLVLLMPILLGSKDLKKKWKELLFLFILFALSLIPIIRLYLFDYGGARLTAISLSGTTTQNISEFLKNYLAHFSFSFLFSNGDINLRSALPGYGEVYCTSLPFIVLGAYKVLKKKSRKYFLPILILFLAPIPAAITKESPHALRSIVMLPMFAMISSIGFGYLVETIKEYKRYVEVVSFLSFFVLFVFFLKDFFASYNLMSSKDWQYGYKEIFEKYGNFKDFSKVYISDSYGQPYTFMLFYEKVDPRYFRDNVLYNPPDKWGISLVSGIGTKYKFTAEDITQSDLKMISFVAPKDSVNTSLLGVKVNEIKFLDGSVAFNVYEK